METLNGKAAELVDRAAETRREREDVLEVLHGEVRQMMQDAATYLTRQERNLDVHYAWWDGQAPDGRKHAEFLNGEAFPWENASDTRVRLAEDIVNDECTLMELALARAKVKSMPVGEEDQPLAARNAKLMRWVLKQHLRHDLAHEAELARQWRQIHGAALMRVTWQEEMTLVPQVLVAEDVVTQLTQERVMELMAAGGAGARADEVMIQAMEDAQDVLYNEGRGEELEERLSGFYAGVGRKAVKAAVKALRAGEEAELLVPDVLASGPRLRAMRIGDDVLIPAGCDDVRKARVIAVREWLGEAELREREESEEWEAGFVDALLAHKGRSVAEEGWGQNLRRRGYAARGSERLETDTREACEVWTVYRRAVTREGKPGIFCSVFSPLVKDVAGKRDEALDYRHGRQPFVELRRERKERAILESRGVPEVVLTWQNEVKVQRDARTDRAQIETLPPVNAPTGSSRQKLNFGPCAINYLRDPSSVKFMAIGGNPGSSIEVERRTMEEVNWFFARDVETVPPGRRLRYQQKLVDNYLGEMMEVMLQVWSLCAQYMAPERVARIVGGAGAADAQAGVLVADEGALRENPDMYLSFDAREADPEMVKELMELVNTAILPADAGGVIDRAKFTRWQMYAVNAELAEEVVRPVESAAQSEVEDEQVQLTKLFQGIEPPMKEGGNAQLRLQTMMNTLQANPRLQQQAAKDDLTKRMLEARMQHFQHALQQEQNKVIGRVGAAPVLGEG